MNQCSAITAQRLAAAQLHWAFERLRLSIVMTIAVAMLIAVSLWRMFNDRLLLQWVAAVLIVALGRAVLWWAYRRARPAAQDVPRWEVGFSYAAAAQALAWSYGATRLAPTAVERDFAVLAVTLVAVAAVSTSALAPCRRALTLFVVLILAPFGLHLLGSDDWSQIVVGVALLVAMGALLWSGYQSNRSLCQLMRTELELSAAVQSAAQARSAAEEANQAKSRFLATMSHEVRTPLNGILGLAEMLQSSSLTPDQRRQVELLRRSGDHLLGIVNDILDFSKIQSGRLEINQRPIVLAEFLEEVAGPWRERAAQRGIVLTTRIEPCTPPVIVSDPLRLRQILANLLSNATKFTERGTIDVHVAVREGAPGASAVLLEFAVSDSGIGIPDDRVGRVFEPFTQVDDSATRRAGGTGLGLAICRSLAQLLGGAAGVTSRTGAGSRFWFTARVGVAAWDVPMAAPLPLPDASAAVLKPPAGDGHVLIAEDNLINLEVACAMLRKLGISHEIARDGRELLERATDRRFDLVLLDCQMPEMDGYEAAVELRRRGVSARNGGPIPIVALTANACAEDRERALAVGMDDFLAKPVRIEQLEQMLRRWLDSAPRSQFAMIGA
ncbi:MAG: ATP-binding protein [Steroidobacteraceae bacterium]|nr:ATP-binding protein [Steroidobacteraceae bacterium]MDW8258566.1 ATP-binding protein [Gammaproteobacteria bacterium]